MRATIGIDPGKAGALASLGYIGDRTPVLVTLAMPVVKARTGKGRDEYDVSAIRDWLRRYVEGGFAMLEKGQTLPPSMGGSAANFQRGYGRGLFEGLLVGLGIPYQLVPPKRWQKVMHEGTSGRDLKQRSIMAVQRLFPLVSLLRTERCRKADDGLAEAVLLAAYAQRVQSGHDTRSA